MNAIRVLVFDDNNDRRDSLGMLIRATGELELAGTYSDCMNALEVVAESSPHVILMDIEMPGINGITATAIIKKQFPHVNILIQTVFEDPDRIFDSITAGASGYILKSSSNEKIIEAIKEVNSGGSTLSPAVAAKVLTFFKTVKTPKTNVNDYKLSEREQDVLNLLVKGLSYKLIADNLAISYNTVNTHIRKIYEKLQVHSAGEAVAKAISNKIAS
jgi:DNA-binding NarL/FixJ family response regulator